MSDRKPAAAPSVAGPAEPIQPGDRFEVIDAATNPDLCNGDVWVAESVHRGDPDWNARRERDGKRDWWNFGITTMFKRLPRTPTSPTPPVEAEARGYARGLLAGAAWCANYEKALIRHQRGEGQPGASLASISLGQAAAALRTLATAPQGVGDGGGLLLDEMAAALREALKRCTMDYESLKPLYEPLERYDALTTTKREGGAPEVQPGDAGRGRTAEEERADVVAWLRGGYARDGKVFRKWGTTWANEFERGDHIGAGAPRKEQG
jgi:hypothetical protein